MTKDVKSVCFVCMANYCRSPVARILLKNRIGDFLKIDSAGIKPMVAAGMDPRSVEFLKKNNLHYEIHNPKKIDKNILNSSDLIFAMDTTILMYLNRLSKKHMYKIKLFTFQHKNLRIADPFNFPEEDYNTVMEDINFVINNLDLTGLV